MRERPVERLVGAAYWRVIGQCDGTRMVEFEWSVIPSVSFVEQVEFLNALVTHVREQEQSAIGIAPSAWLSPEHPQAAILEAADFTVSGQRTGYEAEAAVWRETLASLLPPSDQVVMLPPAGEHFEELKVLLCGPSLRPSELAHGFQTAGGNAPALFDPRCSAVLIVDGKITAACLANSSQSHLNLAALSGTDEQCAQLLHHCLQARDGLAEPVSIGFLLDGRDTDSGLSRTIKRMPTQIGELFKRYEQRTLNRNFPARSEFCRSFEAVETETKKQKTSNENIE